MTAGTAGTAPYSAGVGRPAVEVPDGAVDAHLHVLLPREFPYRHPTADPPPEATVEDYRRLQQRLGTSRCVVVTPSSYGTDNRCTLAAVAALGADVARGVAVVDESVSEAELDVLAAGHVRGIRFNSTRPGGAPPDGIEPLARRVADRGWHVQLHVPPELLVEMTPELGRLPTDLVLDHVARLPGVSGLDHPAFRVVLDLLDKGRTWVKIGGLYHESAEGPPGYADRVQIATEILRRYPERTVWGSDWPHTPALRGELPLPDDAVLMDLLDEMVSTTDELVAVLVTNPEALYGFTSTSSRSAAARVRPAGC